MVRTVPFLLVAFLTLAVWCQQSYLPGRSRSFVIGASTGDYFDGLVPTNGLISYWDMDEVAAGTSAVTRVDKFSGYDLTDVTPFSASATGILTNAADLELGEYFSKTDNDDLSMGTNVTLSITAWVNFESFAGAGSNSCITSKSSNSSGNNEYVLAYGGTAARLFFALGRASSASTDAVISTNGGALSTATWYFVAATFDPSSNEMKIYKDAGTPDTFGAKTIDPPNSGAPVNVGRRNFSSDGWYFDGLIDELSVWHTVLSADDITDLYNSGAARHLR